VRIRLAPLLLAIALPVSAQRAPRFDIAVAPASALTEGPAVSSDRLLSDAKTREHLRNGFPARIHYRLELWRKGGIFDDLAGRTEWDVLVNYDPSSQLYNAIRRSADDRLREDFGGFQSLTSAEAQIGRAFKPPLHPTRPGRYYYSLTVDIQTLTQSDLDALQQWLRGPDAKTNNPLAVIGSGLGTLLSRVLGGSKTTYVTPSGVFSVE
jgi:hypothetical protein